MSRAFGEPFADDSASAAKEFHQDKTGTVRKFGEVHVDTPMTQDGKSRHEKERIMGIRDQEKPQWKDFDQYLEKIDDDTIRKKLDPNRESDRELIKQLDIRIDELGKLFDGASFPWILDGALNISLLKGDYVGYHKDVDITIEKKDIEQFVEILHQRGYGLFLSLKGDELSLRRVSIQEFLEASDEHRFVIAINKEGYKRDDKELNGIDIHVTQRNARGRVVNRDGTELPEKWFQPIEKNVRGFDIHVSKPARVAYFKLKNGRSYDFSDVKQLVEMGALNLNDVDEIEEIFRKDFENTITNVKAAFNEVAASLTDGMSEENIVHLLLNHAFFTDKQEAVRSNIEYMAHKIAESDNKSGDHMFSLLAERLPPIEQLLDSSLQRVRMVREWVENKHKVDEMRDELSGGMRDRQQ